MTLDEKREYLKQYQMAQNSIVGLTHELEKWQALGVRVNNALSTGGSGSNVKQSKIEQSAVNTADILRTIQTEIDGEIAKRQSIIESLNQNCKKYRHREILKMRYIHGMSNSQIAKQLGKDTKSVSNLVTAALKAYNV